MAENLIDKLHPARFSEMSPLMAAIVGYVLGESFTTPNIAELTVSEQENLVYIRPDGAVGFRGSAKPGRSPQQLESASGRGGAYR